MDEGLHIEAAGPVHTAVLVALYGQCFDDAWSIQSMSQVLRSPGAFARLARQADGAPVGFALARHAGDEVELISLGVPPARRGRGIGGALLRDVIALAQQAGAVRMVLEVAETNDVARRLYAAAGFRAVGRRPDYYQRANSVPVAALTLAREMRASPRAETEKTEEIEVKAQPGQSNFQD